MCVYSFSQPTNYCPEEPTAVATIVFSFTAISLPPPPPYLLSVGRGESEGSLSPRSCSLGESLHHCGTHTHTHAQSNKQLVSSVSFYLSLCHYTLQLSLWPSLWGFDAHSREHTHTHTHLILMFPLYLSLPASQMGLSLLGFVYNRALLIEAECIDLTFYPQPNQVLFFLDKFIGNLSFLTTR